ncbi:type II secretion system (T2SS) protein N [Fluviicoccus keumensis]|uniref:Type II secretion system protein N n=1 Tax=Fluviicoccus keumensis TaxID=1435465 RepID=A0A4Q7YJI6_9GAMM|nr:type II secretion system protein N [Fluviicoccus keumensis]RZU36943.1 type II secretion system (T2SS) protein N [Fluviicoccus keumensis]
MSRKAIKEEQESRAYNWALLATLILLCSLVVQTPARVMAHFLPAQVKPMIVAWGGTIWSGQAGWQYRSLQGQFRWSLDPLALVRLGLGLKWELLSPGSRLSGKAMAASGRWELKGLQGELAGKEIRALVQSWEFPAVQVTVKDVTLQHKGQAWQGSTGRLEWPGGDMSYQVNGQKQALALPPVVLSLDGKSGPLEMTLTESGSGAGLATFMINGDMLEARLRQRLLMHAAGYHGVAEPDAVVVTSSQPLSSL